LVIDSKSVSKMHCILIKTDGLLYVRDLSSTNGTRVNGQRITRGALLPGDRLDFASEKFKVHLGPDGAELGGPVDRTEMIVTPHDPDADTPRPVPGHGSQAEQFR
jgi:pSer/pThr/pTyr-binding forkhead associated (FHA) protein